MHAPRVFGVFIFREGNTCIGGWVGVRQRRLGLRTRSMLREANGESVRVRARGSLMYSFASEHDKQDDDEDDGELESRQGGFRRCFGERL